MKQVFKVTIIMLISSPFHCISKTQMMNERYLQTLNLKIFDHKITPFLDNLNSDQWSHLDKGMEFFHKNVSIE